MSDEVKPVQDGADDLAILHPERERDIAGVKIVMREYGGIEGMRLANFAAPIVRELTVLTDADHGGDDLLAYVNLQTVFAKHVDAVTAMMAQACDQTREWVESLGDEDLQALLVTWWSVNGPFFVRRVVQALQMRLAQKAFDGPTSTPPSPPRGTTSKTSDVTRTVN